MDRNDTHRGDVEQWLVWPLGRYQLIRAGKLLSGDMKRIHTAEAEFSAAHEG